MKKFLLFSFSLLMLAMNSHAQLVDQVKKTITAADTATIKLIKSKVMAVQYTYQASSGTSAGKFYFEVTTDGVGWVSLDSSYSLSNNNNVQTKKVDITSTNFISARVRCSNTSSATAAIIFTVFRRPDDR